MIRSCFLLLLIVSFAQADWPQFRGPLSNGHSSEKGINTNWNQRTPKTLWKVDLSDDGYACPSSADGKVFIIDHKDKQDHVRALDLKTGVEIWRFSYEAKGREDYGFARATPTYEKGVVYTVSRDGVVHALDAKQGKKLWRRDAVKDSGGKPPSWEVASSPVIDGPKLIVPGGGEAAHILALDKKTGDTLWEGGGTFKLGYATPVVTTIEGKKQYLVFNAFGLTGIDADNGKLLWSTRWRTLFNVNAASPIPLGKDRIYISSGYGKGCAVYEIKDNTPNQIWKSREGLSKFNTAVLFDGALYGTSDPGYLVCLDPETGNALWKQKTFKQGGLIAVDGHFIVVDGQSGDVTLVKPDQKAFQSRGSIQPLTGRSWSPPIISNKILILRNRAQIAAVDLSS